MSNISGFPIFSNSKNFLFILDPLFCYVPRALQVNFFLHFMLCFQFAFYRSLPYFQMKFIVSFFLARDLQWETTHYMGYSWTTFFIRDNFLDLSEVFILHRIQILPMQEEWCSLFSWKLLFSTSLWSLNFNDPSGTWTTTPIMQSSRHFAR